MPCVPNTLQYSPVQQMYSLANALYVLIPTPFSPSFVTIRLPIECHSLDPTLTCMCVHYILYKDQPASSQADEPGGSGGVACTRHMQPAAGLLQLDHGACLHRLKCQLAGKASSLLN